MRRTIALCVTAILVLAAAAAQASVMLPGGTPDAANGNLRLWLDAGAGTTGTSNVTGWVDQSANGHVFSTSTGPELISSVAGLNNRPALRFNGSNESLDGPAGIYNSSTSTTFIVAQSKSPGSNNYRFIFDTGGTRYNSFFDNRGGSNQGWGVYMNGPGNFTNPAAVYDDGYDVMAAVVDGASSASRVNGQGTKTGSMNGGGTSGSPFRIGARNSSPAAANYFNADLAEVLVYNRALSSSEENEVGYYLETKYGLDTAYTEPAPPPPVPAGGLVGYWKFDETGPSGTAADSSGLGRDLAVRTSFLPGAGDLTTPPAPNATANFTAGKFGNAIDLAGSVVATTPNLRDGPNAILDKTTSFTISAWILPRAPGVVLDERGTSGHAAQTIVVDDPAAAPVVEMRTWNQPVLAAPGTATLDEWHHVVLRYDRSGGVGVMDAFLDGVKSATSVIGDRLPPIDRGGSFDGEFFVLGQPSGAAFGNNSRFNGLIDDLVVWARPLPDWYIAGLARGHDPLSVPEPSTLLIWALLGGLGIGLGWRRKG